MPAWTLSLPSMGMEATHRHWSAPQEGQSESSYLQAGQTWRRRPESVVSDNE